MQPSPPPPPPSPSPFSSLLSDTSSSATLEKRLIQRLDQLTNVVLHALDTRLTQRIDELLDTLVHERLVQALETRLNQCIDRLVDRPLDRERLPAANRRPHDHPNIQSHGPHQQPYAETSAQRAQQLPAHGDQNNQQSGRSPSIKRSRYEFRTSTRHADALSSEPMIIDIPDSSDDDEEEPAKETVGEETVAQMAEQSELIVANDSRGGVEVETSSMDPPAAKRQRREQTESQLQPKHRRRFKKQLMKELASAFPMKRHRPMAHVLMQADDAHYHVSKTYLAIHHCYRQEDSMDRTAAPMSSFRAAGLQSVLELKPWEAARSKMPSLPRILCKSRSDPRFRPLLHALTTLRSRHFMALWERTHWITFHKARRSTSVPIELKEYHDDRAERAKKVHKYISDLYDLALPLIHEGLVGAEILVYPSIPYYPRAPVLWTPKTTNWMQDVQRVDALEPWRTWWWAAPAQHPYNTLLCAHRQDLRTLAGGYGNK